MKYFTPDMLLRFGSDDPRIADAAQEDWEHASQRYAAYMDTVKEALPPALRRLEENYYLHDAKVRGMGKEDKAFVIILQLDAPPRPLVTVHLDLLEDPVIDSAALAPELRSTGDVEWQYDEFERIAGDAAHWQWNILLSNGWEVHLRFRDLHVQEAEAILPPAHATAPDYSVPQIA